MPSPAAAFGRTDPFAALLTTLMVAILALSPVIHAAGRGEPGVIVAARIDLADAASDLPALKEMDIDVDGVFDGWARVHLLAEELEKLRGLESKSIKLVRGRGLFIGLVLDRPARPYCEALMDLGVLCKETHENVIRFAPPLVVTKKDLNWAFKRVEKVFRKLDG